MQDYVEQIQNYINEYNHTSLNTLLLLHVDWDNSVITLYNRPCCNKTIDSKDYDIIEKNIKLIYPFKIIFWKYRG